MQIPTSTMARVDQPLGRLLHDVARLMRRRFIQRSRQAELPLNRSEIGVLRQVADEQGITQVTLATRLDTEPVTVARLIDRLEVAGLLERRSDPADRRVWTVWLTDKAPPMLERIEVIALNVRREALAGFSAEQHEALMQALCVVRGNLVAVTGCGRKGEAGGE